METLILTPRTDPEATAKAAEILKNGGLVAVPTETVYGLAANALDAEAVSKIYRAKGRPSDNPLIVHISRFEELETLVSQVPESARLLAEKFWPGPLTMVLPKKDIVPGVTSGGLDTVAVRCPENAVANEVIRLAGVPLAAPSANISGLPSPTDFEAVYDDMNGRIDAIIDGGACGVGVESTVVTLCGDVPRVLRPGAVTPEMMEEVIGRVETDESALHPLADGEFAASPGMKYKHYSPNADIFVIRGTLPEFVRFVSRRTGENEGVLCFEGEEKYLPLGCVTMGKANDSLSQAERLFGALRELDARGFKRVYARSPSEDGVGLAVCNRLYRSAAFRFLKASPIIGLTGQTGAGKSTVAKLLELDGCETVDCDKIARTVLSDGSPILEETAKVFGADIIAPDGTLKRQLLAQRAFSSRVNAAKLDAITHPEIIRRALAQAKAITKRGFPAVIDAPLLFESGLDEFCDFSVTVVAPEKVRLRRIMRRDGIEEGAARARMRVQQEDGYYVSRAQYVIRNYEPYELESQLEGIPY